VSAAVEAEWAGLPDDERDLWSEELGEVVRGGAALVRAAYEHLGLITFYTINENEARAHTVVRGTPVVRAAGKVHTDMERGFIRAEVIAAEDLERAGSMSAARRHGLLRMEGRDYVVVDGDIIQIRFAPTG
jgi:ribosome-binding ATPase YchF (GTP1/OBG family)